MAVIRRGVWPLIGALAWQAGAAAAAPPWRVAPREAWIQDAPAAAGPLLHDRQIRVTAEGDDRYEHTIERLAGAASAEQAAPITVSLDPRYQDLVIHSLRLTRGGNLVTRFTAAQIRDEVRTQSAEAEPHRRELDPRLQVSVQVLGARAGDLLECEYTVHSRAARSAGFFAGHYAAQWASADRQPVNWERLRVGWPAGRPMRFRISGGPAGHAPQVRTQPGEVDVEWRDPAPVSDPDLPRWFESRSTVQLSDFTDWREVAALLAPRYGEPPAHTGAPLATGPEQILDALRLVQAKVQALNVTGEGPYAPADPETVLRRGFGDSRDLARLLVSLLRALGVDARVVLADSRHGALLPTRLPSPFMLDTALVRARAGGTDYWLAPAAPGPASALARTDTADLRHALLIGPDADPLLALPQPAPDASSQSVTQQFDLRAGNTRPAALTVTTLFAGNWAQAERATLLAQSPAQRQLAQIQAVAQDYPTAEAQGEVELQDLQGAQSLQLTAHFRIPRPFGDAEDPQFGFFAEALAGAVQPREEARRQAPLGLPWPFKVTEHIEAALPPQFGVPVGKILIETAAFRYQREVSLASGVLRIDHSYLGLSDHVDAADYPAYLAANAQVYQALGLRVRPPAAPWRRALDWLGQRWWAIIALAAVATLAVGAWRRRSVAAGVGQ
ncbi:MAG TPA: DUF3857 domain-containing protein [Steroidobacteraceae bacterium]|nr:DUF3857 domain-containing protein [Steroidobacteraceae bacterium]